MTTLDLIILSLATYRVTRFTSLDSLIDELRDWISKWLLAGDTYTEDDHEWPVNIVKRKALQWVECPYCQSVWWAVGLLIIWWNWYDERWAQFTIQALAVAGAAMIVYRWTDPAPPCLPTKKCP